MILRELEDSDLEAVLSYGTDPEVMYWTIGRPIDRSEEALWISEMRKAAFADPRREFGLAIEVDGQVEGTVTLTVEAADHGRAQLGYALHKRAWGNGYATEAAGLLLAFAFDRLGLHRVYATLDTRNARSRRVLEKIGMTREGTLRDFMRKHDGWFDSDIYACLAGDRPASSQPYT